MLIELAEAYVKALNGGKVPTIENAWNYMQASELERAYKEVVQEYEKTIATSVEQKLPLNDDVLKQLYSKIKTDLIASFKTKVLGDINNAKGIEYLDKLKKTFRTKLEVTRKRNI